MEDRACILFTNGPPDDWPRAARLLGALSPTISAAEATKACRFGHGLVSMELPASEAGNAATALTKAGFPALAFPASQVIRPPRPFTVINADAEPGGLRVQTDLLGQMRVLPWESLRIISVVCVQATMPQASGAVMWTSGGHETPQMESVENRPTRSDTEPQVLIELFVLEPLLRIRIRRHAFNYDYLGSRRTDSSHENFVLLLTDLLKYAPKAAKVGLIEDLFAGRGLEGPRKTLNPIDHERMLTALLTREALVGLPR